MPMILPEERTVYDATLPVLQKYQSALVASVESGATFPSDEFNKEISRSLQDSLQELSAVALVDDVTWVVGHFSGLLSDQTLVDIENALTETLGAYSVLRALYISPKITEATLEAIGGARERYLSDNSEKSWQELWFGIHRAASIATGETTALLSFAKKAVVSVFARIVGGSAIQGGPDTDIQVEPEQLEEEREPGIQAVWETRRDMRVRPKHRALQGAPMERWVQIYRFGPSPGSEALGFSGYNCRCRLRLVETTRQQMVDALGYAGWRQYNPGGDIVPFVASVAGMEE